MTDVLFYLDKLNRGLVYDKLSSYRLYKDLTDAYDVGRLFGSARDLARPFVFGAFVLSSDGG